MRGRRGRGRRLRLTAPARPVLPPAGYVLASALARSLPIPAALPVLAFLRSAEPGPAEVREAREALTRAGLLLPCGSLTAKGKDAAREALGWVTAS